MVFIPRNSFCSRRFITKSSVLFAQGVQERKRICTKNVQSEEVKTKGEDEFKKVVADQPD